MRAVEGRKGRRGVVVVVIVGSLDGYRIRVVVVWLRLMLRNLWYRRWRGCGKGGWKPTSEIGGHVVGVWRVVLEGYMVVVVVVIERKRVRASHRQTTTCQRFSKA